MAGPAHDYTRGEMDIHEQSRTYHSFLVLSKWGSLALIVGVLFFALIFAANVPFLGAAVTAFVVLVLGIVALREKKKTAH